MKKILLLTLIIFSLALFITFNLAQNEVVIPVNFNLNFYELKPIFNIGQEYPLNKLLKTNDLLSADHINKGNYSFNKLEKVNKSDKYNDLFYATIGSGMVGEYDLVDLLINYSSGEYYILNAVTSGSVYSPQKIFLKNDYIICIFEPLRLYPSDKEKIRGRGTYVYPIFAYQLIYDKKHQFFHEMRMNVRVSEFITKKIDEKIEEFAKKEKKSVISVYLDLDKLSSKVRSNEIYLTLRILANDSFENKNYKEKTYYKKLKIKIE